MIDRAVPSLTPERAQALLDSLTGFYRDTPPGDRQTGTYFGYAAVFRANSLTPLLVAEYQDPDESAQAHFDALAYNGFPLIAQALTFFIRANPTRAQP